MDYIEGRNLVLDYASAEGDAGISEGYATDSSGVKLGDFGRIP